MTPAQGYPDAPIHELFERQAGKTPDRIALIDGKQRITFAELNARANQFAWGLVERGVRRETFVGLCVERSIQAIVALIGILNAGAAYVYLDPAYPQRRLREMTRDAGLELSNARLKTNPNVFNVARDAVTNQSFAALRANQDFLRTVAQ